MPAGIGERMSKIAAVRTAQARATPADHDGLG